MYSHLFGLAKIRGDRHLVTRSLVTTLFSITSIVAFSPVLAGPITLSGTFQIEDANMWTGGGGATYALDKMASLSLDSNLSVGGIEEGLFGDQYGASLSGSTSGSLDLNFAMHATAGRVDATLPFSLTLTMPDALRPGEAATVKARVDYGSGFGFTTNSPDVGFRMGMGFDLSATASAQACFIDCAGFTDQQFLNIPHFDQELLAVNMGAGAATSAAFDQQIRILGQQEALGANFTDIVLDNLGTDIPLVKSNTTGQTVVALRYGGLDQTTLLPVVQTTGSINTATQSAASSGLADVLSLTLDVGQLATTLANGAGIPIPPPAGSVDQILDAFGTTVPAAVRDVAEKVGYNLFTAKVGASLGFQQDFELMAPTLSFDIDFGNGVQHITAGVGADIEQSIFVPDTLFGKDDVTITPTIDLNSVMFSNRTSLYVDPVAEFSALALSLGPLSLGPVLDETARIPTPRLTLFEDTFALPDPGSIIGKALTFGIDNTPQKLSFDELVFNYNDPSGGDLFNNLYTANSVIVSGDIPTVLEQSSILIANGGQMTVQDRNFTLKGRSVIAALDGGTFDLVTMHGDSLSDVSIVIDGSATLKGAKAYGIGSPPNFDLYPGATLELVNSSIKKGFLASSKAASVTGSGGKLLLNNSSVESVYGGVSVTAAGGNNELGSFVGSTVSVLDGSLKIGAIPSESTFTKIILNSNTKLTLTGDVTFIPTFDTTVSIGGNSRIVIGDESNPSEAANITNMQARRAGDAGGHLSTVGTAWFKSSRFGDATGNTALASLTIGGSTRVDNSYFGVSGVTRINAGASLRVNHTGTLIKSFNSAGGYENDGSVFTNGWSDFGTGTFRNNTTGFVSVSGGRTFFSGFENVGGRVTVGSAGRLYTADGMNIHFGTVDVFGVLDSAVEIMNAGKLTLHKDSLVLKDVHNDGGVLETTGGLGSMLGDYIQEADGTFRMSFTGASYVSTFIFEGDAMLDGKLEIDLGFYNPMSDGFQFTLLGFLGERTGDFTGIDISYSTWVTGNFAWELFYSDFPDTGLETLSLRFLDLDSIISAGTDLSDITFVAAHDFRSSLVLAGGDIPLPNTVPEPTTIPLIMVGLLPLLFAVRRRHKMDRVEM